MMDGNETKPEPFQIRVEPAVLDDLHARLARTRWTTIRDGDGWERGTERSYLRRLVAYWGAEYDWKRHELGLNALPQFKAQVRGARLHFVHARGRGSAPLPLLLLHGWPDSFYRFHKVIPLFTEPARAGLAATDSFDVVAPSLPGFAFTDAIEDITRQQPNRRSADLLWRLMTEVLGYERFVVAGGDGGGAIAQIMAIDHPESVSGIHLTDLGWHVSKVDRALLSRAEQKQLEASEKAFMADGAYVMVQTTQPQSLAAGLSDSPVGLASWILDRFHAWTDPEVENGIDQDELLTNIMIYWVTRTIASSMFSYYAEAQSPSLTPSDRVERPVGLALFPKDIGGIPLRSFAERTLNVVRWTEMSSGGHFAALEVPHAYVLEVSEFCRQWRAHRAESREEQAHVTRTV